MSEPTDDSSANRRAAEKAVRDLLFDLRTDQGGWNPQGIHKPIKHMIEQNVPIITYTYDSDIPFGYDKSVTQYGRINSAQRHSVEHALREIEKVANVTFRCIGHVDSLEKVNIRFLQANVPPLNNMERGGTTQWSKGLLKINIIISNKLNTRSSILDGTVIHEVLHALGLSHPHGDGLHNGFNTDMTIMSYYPGYGSVRGLGPLDVAALQYIYGKPSAKYSSQLITSRSLRDSTVFDAANPVNLDLRDEGITGNLNVDLREERVVNHIVGELTDSAASPAIDKTKQVRSSLTLGTRVQDVLSGKGIQLEVIGNELPNRLQGGDGNDNLRAHGGKDILTGGKGKDWFIFAQESGRSNIVTDFCPAENDRIVFLKNHLEFAGMHFRTNVEMDGKLYTGTEIRFQDKNGKIISTVLIKDITPEALRDHIYSKTTVDSPPPKTRESKQSAQITSPNIPSHASNQERKR